MQRLQKTFNEFLEEFSLEIANGSIIVRLTGQPDILAGVLDAMFERRLQSEIGLYRIYFDDFEGASRIVAGSIYRTRAYFTASQAFEPFTTETRYFPNGLAYVAVSRALNGWLVQSSILPDEIESSNTMWKEVVFAASLSEPLAEERQEPKPIQTAPTEPAQTPVASNEEEIARYTREATQEMLDALEQVEPVKPRGKFK